MDTVIFSREYVLVWTLMMHNLQAQRARDEEDDDEDDEEDEEDDEDFNEEQQALLNAQEFSDLEDDDEDEEDDEDDEEDQQVCSEYAAPHRSVPQHMVPRAQQHCAQ